MPRERVLTATPIHVPAVAPVLSSSRRLLNPCTAILPKLQRFSPLYQPPTYATIEPARLVRLLSSFPVPLQKNVPERVQGLIRGKSDRSYNDDTGKDSLHAKSLLCLQDHVAEALGGPNHFTGDDHNKRDAPRDANAREHIRQACGHHDLGDDLRWCGPQGSRGSNVGHVDSAHAGIGVENDGKRTAQCNKEDLRAVPNAQPKYRQR